MKKKYRVCAAFPWRNGWTIVGEFISLLDCEASTLLLTGHVVLVNKTSVKKEKAETNNG